VGGGVWGWGGGGGGGGGGGVVGGGGGGGFGGDRVEGLPFNLCLLSRRGSDMPLH